MPDARDENVCCLRNNSIANDIAGRAEADHDLADVSIFGPHAQGRKFLQSLDRGPQQRQCAPCGTGISLIEKGSQSLDILHGVGRKKDHPTLRGCGRFSSSADPQLATQALTSSSRTPSRLSFNSSYM